MTQPSRPPDAHGTEAESAGQLDATLARPEGEVVLSPLTQKIREPEFDPPAAAGEVGTLGRYRVLKKLGQGGMGAVYLGYDVKLGRKVALKVMLPEHAEDPESRERFLREARAAAMLKSDHVVTLFDVGEERGVAFIAMEYLSGSPLDQYLRGSGEVPLSHVFRVGRETAMGLAAAHDLGLVHRDIKPGNIWLEAPHGRVKILDFGLARAANDDTHLTTTGLVVGTPAFMSPEQARGQPLDGRSDLFSLGIVLYRLATGKMPFDGTTTMALLTSLAVDDPVPVRRLKAAVPPALEAVIHKLLAKKVADRYATAWEAAAALRDAERAPAADGQLPLVVQPVPMAVAPQTDNVWAGIEESASHAVPLSSGTSAVAEDAPSVRRKLERPPSKAPLLAGGAVLLAAIAVLAVVLAWPKKKPEVVEKEPEKVAEKRTPAPKLDLERKAAEAVLSAGGFVGINGDAREIAHASDLPRGPFTLTRVNLAGRMGATDATIAALAGCKGLLALHLDHTPITDTWLAHLKGIATLTALDLGDTRVTDAGLANFANCTELTDLGLHGTDVSEPGLANFKGTRNLVGLRLGEMKRLTDVSLAFFAGNTNLEGLVLAGSSVTDAGLGYLKNCKNLAHLDLFDTAIGNETVKNFADCKQMRVLTLAGTKVDDDGVAFLRDNKSLSHLHLDRTAITDTALPHLYGCSGLTYLDISGTKTSEPKVRELAKALPGCRIKWNGVFFEPTEIRDSDRRAAEYALSVGGVVTVRVTANGSGGEVKAAADLPKEPFTVLTLNVSNLQKVTDEGLAAVRGCKNIKFLYLNSSPKLTDEGMKHFAGMTEIADIMLYGTRVTDEGLKNFKGCKSLNALNLNYLKVTDEGVALFKDRKTISYLSVAGTPVTDATLELCKGLPRLQTLDVRGTKVTPRKVAELAKLLPGCRIEHDGGVFEPKAGADIDRAVAEWVIAAGGSAYLNGTLAGVRAAAELPKEPFAFTGINFANNADISDDALARFRGSGAFTAVNLSNTKVTDAGLAHLAGNKGLVYLWLAFTGTTDAGLAHFKECKDLNIVDLQNTKVGDAGLAHLKDCKTLTSLRLTGAPVGDAGLAALTGTDELRLIELQKTSVTAKGAAEFARRNPQCKIVYDDGIIEPPKK